MVLHLLKHALFKHIVPFNVMYIFLTCTQQIFIILSHTQYSLSTMTLISSLASARLSREGVRGETIVVEVESLLHERCVRS